MTTIQGPDNQLTQPLDNQNESQKNPGNTLSHHTHEQIDEPFGTPSIYPTELDVSSQGLEIIGADNSLKIYVPEETRIQTVTPDITTETETAQILKKQMWAAELEKHEKMSNKRHRINLSFGAAAIVAVGASVAFLLSGGGSRPSSEASTSSVSLGSQPTPSTFVTPAAPKITIDGNPASPEIVLSTSDYSHETTQIKPTGFNERITYPGPITQDNVKTIAAYVIKTVTTNESYGILSGDTSYIATTYSEVPGAINIDMSDPSSGIDSLDGVRNEVTTHAGVPQLGSMGLYNQPKSAVEYTLPKDSKAYTIIENADGSGSTTITIDGTSAQGTFSYEDPSDNFKVQTKTAVKAPNNNPVFQAILVRDSAGNYTYLLNGRD